jgi:membrane fusion protein, multidrug efflux system
LIYYQIVINFKRSVCSREKRDRYFYNFIKDRMMASIDILKRLAVAGTLAGILMMPGCKDGGSPHGPSVAQQKPVVGVMIMQARPVVLTTELSGRITPWMVAEVRPQVTGIIKKRLFTEGGEVKAGEALYQIDPASYQAALDSARAVLSKAEANKFTISQKAQRYKELVTINAVSKQEFDDAEAAMKQSEADIEGAKAAVETAKINLSYTKITAPISGIVGRSSVTAGALVIANQASALATIQQIDPVYVDVTQSSADLLRLKRKLAASKVKDGNSDRTKVKLLLEDGSSYPLEGTMKFSEVTVEQSTGSITLRAQFPNPHHLLLPGMFVRAIVQEGVQESAILVPQQAVSRNQSGNAVAMVVNDKNVVESRVLKTEQTVGDAWLVADGLKVGDRVIVDGFQRIRPGIQVQTVPSDAKVSDADGQSAALRP